MSLQERAVRALDDAAGALQDAGAAALLAALVEARDSLRQPMRVAVIGRVKAGKSTMMNALLGEPVAATGPDELTFNVTVFRHGEPPSLTVHFKDRRESETQPLSWLARAVDRTSVDTELLRNIRHVEVGLPRPILTRLQLIDTPGFGSFFDDDSRNTLDFLGLSPDQVDGVTREHALGADAVLYLFRRGMGSTDRSYVEDFQGAAIGDFTPVNAIALLTKVDAYWSPTDPAADPFAAAKGIVDRLSNEPGIDRLFFDIVPVCGLLAAGAACLRSDDVEVLTDLAKLPKELLQRRIRYAHPFVTEAYDDVPVPAELRAGVVERFGQFGVWLACSGIREEALDESSLRQWLLDRSGITQVEDVLLTHFGNRAAVIKASAAINRSRAASSRLAREAEGRCAAGAAAAAGRLEAFEMDEPAVGELELLRRLYGDEGQLGLSSAEVREVLAVTGEQGPTCAARLGLGPRSTPDEMLAVVQSRVVTWRRRAEEFGISSATMHAARGVQRSYEQIAWHVREAKRHLEMD